MAILADKTDLGFDPEALREKYRQERDRRLRDDGNAQYVEIAGDYARYLEDPFAPSDFSRDPIERDVDLVCFGGGFSGLLTGARLREKGVDDFLIIEKGADFGGTWYWNRYPGAACDTESYIYMPLLEETGYLPAAKYAKAPELFEHSRRIGRHFRLYENALFQTEAKDARWDENSSRWIVTTNRGDVLRARFIVVAGGLLHRPKLPGIPGVDTFKGHSFHTSRWDYGYTGGDSSGNMTGLADKVVGIIGTGATAVQCVPHLGASAKDLFVFQRTPSSVDVRNDRPTDPAWASSLRPGWQKARIDNFSAVVSGEEFDEDMVNDGWTDLIGNILLLARRKERAGEKVEDPQTLIQFADYQKMERVRARVDEIVQDKMTADALKPWYDQFCKRPCFHDQYLQTFNRPNVHLIDTAGKGVERITENGVVVAGKEYKLDCLIYSTGFEVGTDYSRRIGMEITGRDGITLTKKFEGGAETLHGIFSRGFPNMLLIQTAQGGYSANFQHMLAETAKHIAFVASEALKNDLRTLEPEAQAEADWVKSIVRMSNFRAPFLKECTPGYYNNEGQPDEVTAKNGSYLKGPNAFVRLLEGWRAEGTMRGLEVSR
ncbi:MAG: NAD(P)/FAD-dependent oxidoreductase [Methylobacteriaceae bacterium]|nr:NAD(P)/FAD-dependent oxidoreductase [Methylobacteriaceae bacterium]